MVSGQVLARTLLVLEVLGREDFLTNFEDLVTSFEDLLAPTKHVLARLEDLLPLPKHVLARLDEQAAYCATSAQQRKPVE